MNILHLVDEPYDSGIVHYALTLAKGLKDKGHSVIVGGLAGAFPLDEARRLGLEAVSIRRFPAGVLDLRRLIREKKIQIVNAHTGASQVLAVAAAKLVRPKVQVVRTRGDSRPVRRSRTSGMLWRRTAGFIAPTERIRRDFENAWPRTNIRVGAVLPGVTGPLSSGHAPEPQSPPYRIGLLGRLDPVKGHASFLRAAKLVLQEHPESLFMIAGREENVRIPELERLARDFRIQDQVKFLGHVPNAWDFMQNCHVGVIASIGSEAVSRAAIEWMSIGKPIVATRVGSLPEIVDDGETGFLVPPDFPEAMARRIAELLEKPALRERMGAESIKRFESRFSFPRFIADTEKFYEDTLRNISSR